MKQETKEVQRTPTTEEKSAPLVTGVKRPSQDDRDRRREDDQKDG